MLYNKLDVICKIISIIMYLEERKKRMIKFKKILAAAGGVLMLSALCAASCYAAETTGGTTGDPTSTPTESTEPTTPTPTPGPIKVERTDGTGDPVYYETLYDADKKYDYADYTITITKDVDPIKTSAITISNASVEIAEGVTLHSYALTINPAAKLTINGTLNIKKSKKLTVKGTVVNNGTIIGNEGSIMDLQTDIQGTDNKAYAAQYYKWNIENSKWDFAGVEVLTPEGKHDSSYSSVSSALLLMPSNGTIKLHEDILQSGNPITGGNLKVNKNVNMDLNGKTLTLTENCLFTVESGCALTIKDDTAKTNEKGEYIAGKITSTNDSCNFTINVKNDANLTLQNGIIEYPGASGSAIAIDDGKGQWRSQNASVIIEGGLVTSNDTGISLSGILNTNYDADEYQAVESSVTVRNNGIIKANSIAIFGNGNSYYTKINIEGGTVYSNQLAIYHPQKGELKVTGGTITGGITGIEMRSGDLTVSGGTITSTYTGELTANLNGSGSTVTGAAVAVSQHGTENPINVVISDQANLVGKTALYEIDTYGTPKDINIKFTGGTATGAVSSQNCTGFISGGTFTEDVMQYVASGHAEKTEPDKYTVIKASANADAGTYKTDAGNDKYSQLEIVDKTISSADDNTVKFTVIGNNNTTTINGTLPVEEINGATVRVGLIVTDIPKTETVSIKLAQDTVTE